MVCFLYKINEMINTTQMKIIFTKLLFRRAGEIAQNGCDFEYDTKI